MDGNSEFLYLNINIPVYNVYISGSLRIKLVLQNGKELSRLRRFAMMRSATFCSLNTGHKVEMGEFPQMSIQYVKYG